MKYQGRKILEEIEHSEEAKEILSLMTSNKSVFERFECSCDKTEEGEKYGICYHCFKIDRERVFKLEDQIKIYLDMERMREGLHLLELKKFQDALEEAGEKNAELESKVEKLKKGLDFCNHARVTVNGEEIYPTIEEKDNPHILETRIKREECLKNREEAFIRMIQAEGQIEVLDRLIKKFCEYSGEKLEGFMKEEEEI
jgi:hypothetical protein